MLHCSGVASGSDANCDPGPTIKMLPLFTPYICLQQYKMKENAYHAYYNYCIRNNKVS